MALLAVLSPLVKWYAANSPSPHRPAPARSASAQPAAGVLYPCCYEGASKESRRSLEGASKGFGGFSLFSSHLCCPPTHRAIPRFFLLVPLQTLLLPKGYTPFAAQIPPQPPRSWQFNPLPSQAQTSRMNHYLGPTGLVLRCAGGGFRKEAHGKNQVGRMSHDD